MTSKLTGEGDDVVVVVVVVKKPIAIFGKEQ